MDSVGVGRRVAHVVRPSDGEGFASWLDRSAAGLGAPAGVLGAALGIPLRGDEASAVPAFLGVAVSRMVRDRVSAAAGLATREVEAMQLASFHGTAADFSDLVLNDERCLKRIGRREWVLLHASRACPECLAEASGVWRVNWKLSWAAFCEQHGCLLLGECPGCGTPLRAGQRGRPRLLSRVQVPDPLLCGSRSRTGACSVDVSALPAGGFDGPGLRAQRVLEGAAASGQALPVGGELLAPPALFARVRALAAVIRFAGRADLLPHRLPDAVVSAFEDHVQPRGSTSGGVSGYTDKPASPEVAAALLAVLEPILLSANADAHAEALWPLCEAVADRRRELDRFPLGRLLLPAQVLRAAAPPLPHARVAAHAPAVRTTAAAELRCVPELLDVGLYTGTVAPFLPGTAELTGRRFAALAAARCLGAKSWRAAGIATGCDATSAVRTADVVARRIVKPAEFWDAVALLADDLLGAGVDYRLRRERLAGLLRVDPASLRLPARQQLAPWTESRGRLAAAWIWAEVAGGDWRRSPALGATDWSASVSSRRDLYRRFVRRMTGQVVNELRTSGMSLVLDADE